MHFGKVRFSLIGARESAQLCVLIEIAEKGNADGSAGASNVIFVAGIDGGRFGRVVFANAVGLDDGGMPGEIGGCQLIAAAGRDNNIDNFKNGRHLLDGQRSRAIGLDIFDGGIEAGGAEVGWASLPGPAR